MEAVATPIRAYINSVRKKQPEEKKRTGKQNPMDCRQSDEIAAELEKRGIYKRFSKVTFAEIVQRGLPDGYEDTYRKIKAYADCMEANSKTGKGLLLKGECGTMKTTYAVAVLR